jgi:hypothetical protein
VWLGVLPTQYYSAQPRYYGSAPSPPPFGARGGQRYNNGVITDTPPDFEVALEETDEGCLCRVREAPAGQIAAYCTIPVVPRELERLGEMLANAPAQGDGANRMLADRLRGWGEQLFDGLFQADILACLRASQNAVADTPRTMHLRLDLTGAPQLLRLPWEFLYDREWGRYLALSMQTPFSRYTGMMHKLLPHVSAPPLRALVVIASPNGYPAFDVQRGWLGLLDKVDHLARDRKITFEWLQKPTLLDLQRRLRQGEYSILHFIGHSAFDRQTGEGSLIFEDEMGGPRIVTGQHLGAMLRDHYTLRLVVLTGAGGVAVHPTSSAYLPVAQHLVRRGMGAVIAQYFPWPIHQSLEFLDRFYTLIGDQEPVDVATAKARLVVRGEPDEIWWAAPILTMRVADGLLFDDGTRPRQVLPKQVVESALSPLNSLRIRSANLDTMARWGATPAEPRKPNGS